jgi:1-acyl-sn-glycerol-3-phosphate acyltransferase
MDGLSEPPYAMLKRSIFPVFWLALVGSGVLTLSLIIFEFSRCVFRSDWYAESPVSTVSALGWLDLGCWIVVCALLFMPSPLGHSLREKAFRAFGAVVAGAIYRVRTFGLENLPKGGFLLLPNHMTYVDAVVLQLSCPRPIRFIVHESIYNIGWLKPIFQLIQAIPISNTRAKDAIRTAVERVKAGEIICIYPEGELTRTGTLLKLKKGFELIARLGNVPAVPVFADGLWGSIFSFERNKYFFKWPRRIPQLVRIAYGKPIPPEELNIAIARERLLELGEFCFAGRPEIKKHLGRATVAGLHRHQFHEAVIDGMDGRRLKGGDLHRAESLDQGSLSRQSGRCGFTARSRRGHRQPGRDSGEQGPGESEFHLRTHSARIRDRAGPNLARYLGQTGYEAVGRLPLATRRVSAGRNRS